MACARGVAARRLMGDVESEVAAEIALYDLHSGGREIFLHAPLRARVTRWARRRRWTTSPLDERVDRPSVASGMPALVCLSRVLLEGGMTPA